MDEWRTEVIPDSKPRKKKKRFFRRLGEIIGSAVYLGALGGIAYCGTKFIETGVIPLDKEQVTEVLGEDTTLAIDTIFPLAEEQVLEGIVVHDFMHVDIGGTYHVLGQYIEDAELFLNIDLPDSTPPFLDTYFVTILDGCTPYVVEMHDMSWIGERSRYQDIDGAVDTGTKVRITAIPHGERLFGTGIEILGYGELPEECEFIPEIGRPVVQPVDLELSWNWFLIQDAYLVESMTADPNYSPIVSDPVELAKGLLERLLEADSSFCAIADPVDVFKLDHAELIRLYLLFEHFENQDNIKLMGDMLEDDNADIMGEHGGRISWDETDIAFEDIPNPVLRYLPRDHPDVDFTYYFNVLDYKGLHTLAMYHFHACYPREDFIFYGNGACPSEPDIEGVISSKVDGVVVSLQPENTFNVIFYTHRGTVLNLGAYEYGD